MNLRSLMVIPALVLPLGAQAPAAPLREDPLAPPPELAAWVRQVTHQSPSIKGKVQSLLFAIFRPVEDNGLGMVYDNAHTRTVKEVWSDRKANCLGLTALMVAACRTLGLEPRFAEPTNVNHWKRAGNLIRLERHLVAFIPVPPLDDLVADFLPQLRRRQGVYLVDVLTEARVRALFFSNRAVELMGEGNLEWALEASKMAIRHDPTSAAAWNIQGVILRAHQDQAGAEKSYRRAHALDPKDGAPIGNLEMILKETDRWEEAAKFRALSMETRKRDPYFNAFLAEEAHDSGKVEEALEHIQAAIKLLPSDPELHLTEARFRLEQGRPDDARKALENARKWAQPAERERYDAKLSRLAALPKAEF